MLWFIFCFFSYLHWHAPCHVREKYLRLSLATVAAGFGVRPTEHRVLRGMVTFAVVAYVELKEFCIKTGTGVLILVAMLILLSL